MRGTRKNVPLHCLQRFLTGELALESKRFDIKGKDLQVVVMHNTIIPRRAGTIIAAVGAFHLGVTREPSRVVILAGHAVWGSTY